MTQESPSIVVTGANKGIGLAIVRELSKTFQGTVYLAARDASRGKEAVEKLKKDGANNNVHFLELDVTNKTSIEKARDFLKEKHGGLDVLINNAGIFKGNMADSSHSSLEEVKETIATNFTGLLDVCRILFPILRPHARVVNVSSSVCGLQSISSQLSAMKQRLIADDLTVEELEKIVSDYVQAAENGKLKDSGYPTAFGPYAMSKIAVTALSRVQQRLFNQDKTRPDIVLNACCPGYIATDLNCNSGHKTAEQGADTPVYLALLPPQTGSELVKPRGEFVYERQVKDWADPEAWNRYFVSISEWYPK